jgi:hypothetical protein
MNAGAMSTGRISASAVPVQRPIRGIDVLQNMNSSSLDDQRASCGLVAAITDIYVVH